ncbi:MAG: restriction endonuclease subunit S [Gammaproteobacteria bacterium]|nr:MAG: restriction endonuclease subunit S [Gammaproteobacteria bacterium]
MSQRHPNASLSTLASIRSGFPFRERIKHVNTGDVRVLQIRDLRLNPVLKATNLPLITSPKGRAKFLEPGDIVIPARGEHYHAVNFTLSEPTLASSQLLTLRVTSDTVLPGYLCWALNQPKTQHTLRNESRGTNMPLLTRQSLSMVKVPVPPLATQQKIIDLQQLWEQEQQLTQQLLNNRESMLKGMFKQLLRQTGTPVNPPAPHGEQE